MPSHAARTTSVGAQARATKYALFGVYLSALSLATSPHARIGGQLSTLHGLSHGRGRPHRSPRTLVWGVGPMWGAWSAWFDALVGVFRAGGRCHVAGAGHLALAGRGLEWATGAPRLPRFRAPTALTPETPHEGGGRLPHFWAVLRAHRGMGEARPPRGAPIFTVGGGRMGPQEGWRVLPGPLGCPRLAAFTLSAAFAAYRAAQSERA